MALSYVSPASPSFVTANAGDLVLAFAFTTSAGMTTPVGWTSLVPGGAPNILRAWYVPSWSTSMTNTPNFGSTSAIAFATYADAYLDSVTSGSGTTGQSPATATTSAADWIVSAVGLTYMYESGVPTSCPAAMTSRSFSTGGSGYNVVGLADTNGGSVHQGQSKVYTWPAETGQAFVTACVSVAIVGGAAPSAPTLVSPTPGTYLDATAAPAFQATYNNTDLSTCGAYQFRAKPSGGAYSYYNAGSNAFQSSAVWNPGSMTLTAPGFFANGNTYNWSFNSQSSYGTVFSSGFASDSTFVAEAAPTVTVTGPTGTVASSSATVAWTETLASGAVQTAYQVLTYLTSTATASGFVPGQATGLLSNSSVQSGTATSHTTRQLPNEANLTSYVQITETGNLLSSWSAISYSTLYSVPVIPTVTAAAATDVNGIPCVALTVSGAVVGNTLTIMYTDAANPTPTPMRFADGLVVPTGYGAVDNTGTVMTTTTSTSPAFDAADSAGDETFDAGSVWDDATVVTTTVTSGGGTTGSSGYTVNDYEAIPLVARTYTASQSTVPASSNGYVTIQSPSSAPATSMVVVGSWWLIEPTNPAGSLPLNVTDNPVQRYASVATHYPLSPPGVPSFPVVVQGGTFGQDGSVIVETVTQATFAALEASLYLGTVKWLMSPYGWGVYCQIGTANPLAGISGQVQQTSIVPSPALNPIRMVTVQYTEQAMP